MGGKIQLWVGTNSQLLSIPTQQFIPNFKSPQVKFIAIKFNLVYPTVEIFKATLKEFSESSGKLN